MTSYWLSIAILPGLMERYAMMSCQWRADCSFGLQLESSTAQHKTNYIPHLQDRFTYSLGCTHDTNTPLITSSLTSLIEACCTNRHEYMVLDAGRQKCFSMQSTRFVCPKQIEASEESLASTNQDPVFWPRSKHSWVCGMRLSRIGGIDVDLTSAELFYRANTSNCRWPLLRS